MCPSIRAIANPTCGTCAVLVKLPGLIGRVAKDGVAPDDVEGQGLTGQAAATWPRPIAPATRLGKRVAQVKTMWPPSDPPTTASRRLDAQVVHQAALNLDHVADGNEWKIGAVGACPWAGLRLFGPVVPRQLPRMFGQTTKKPVRVDRAARARPRCPTSPGSSGLIVPGNVRVAGKRVANQHRVVPRWAELPEGLIGHGHFGEMTAQFQNRAAG